MKSEEIQQSIIQHRQRRPFNIQHSTFNIALRATIQHSTLNIQHSTFNIQHSKMNNSTLRKAQPFNTQHSTLNIQVATAVFMLIGGLALAVAGFIVPPLGQIHESVLGIFAECLIYAGSIFGVTVYIRTKYTEMKTYLDESLKKNEK